MQAVNQRRAAEPFMDCRRVSDHMLISMQHSLRAEGYDVSLDVVRRVAQDRSQEPARHETAK